VDDAELRPRGAVVKMAPYSPPSAGRAGKLRLDFNENTVGCSPAVVRALVQAITQERLTIYPEYKATREVLSEFFAIPQSQFLLTNGTDEAIQVLVNTFVDDDEEAIVLTPSYAMYRFYAEVAGAKVVNLPYRAGSLAFPLEELLATITPATRAILISNPNNPTGTGIGIETIETILKHAPRAAVLLDEAYYEFCGVTALSLIDRYQNLFVSRTFSKAYGLAGLRIGCLFSQEDNVKFLHKAQSPYSVNILAAVAARAGVGDPAFVKDFVRQAILARDLLYAGFEKRGIPFYKSQGNFVLFHVGDASIAIRDGLRERGVLVRDRSYEIEGCVRVTAGTPAQVERFFAALDEVRN
jgi:histidinol-phosphate aminotransferase